MEEFFSKKQTYPQFVRFVIPSIITMVFLSFYTTIDGFFVSRFVNSNANSNYRYYGKAMNDGYILLNNSGIDEVFDILKERQVTFQKEYKDEQIELKDENPNLHFVMEKKGKEEYEIVLNKKTDIMREIEILNGKSYK